MPTRDLDPDRVRELRRDFEQDEIREIVTTLLDDMPGELHRAAEAARVADAQTVAAVIHKLKSGLLLLGAMRTYRAATAGEQTARQSADAPALEAVVAEVRDALERERNALEALAAGHG